jgi:hypothetical protein
MFRPGFVASVFASSGLLLACGGRSELDDYANGVPTIVPASNAGGGGGNNAGDGDTGDGDSNANGDGDSNANGDGDSTTRGADVGDACEENGDCMGGANASCLDTLPVMVFGFSIDITFPGGACTIRNCKTDADCPKESGCLSGFAEPACTRTCNDASECRMAEGYTCNTIMGSMDTRKFCQPPLDLGGFAGGIPGGGGIPGL